jgi:hypothetical protein
MKHIWVEESDQKAWLWVAVAFAAFYFGEAILFWGPKPLVAAPPMTPLVYWGAFGATIIWLLSRTPKGGPQPTASGTPRALQNWVLGIGITAAVVGMAYFTMIATRELGVMRSVTAGHVIILGAMFEAGVIIGGLSGNPGWIAAGAVWLLGGALILIFPGVQDYTLGAVVTLGFALIGLLRRSLRVAKENE